MFHDAEILVGAPEPPITLVPRLGSRAAFGELTRRIARLACALSALALPVLGIVAADAVHRVGDPGTMQAAVPVFPSTGAAAADHGLRKTFVRRSDAFAGRLREARR